MALSDLNVEQLKTLAADKGVSLAAGLKKAEIVAALEAAGVTDEPTPPGEESVEEEPKATSRFYVHLFVDTLARNPMIVEATDEDDARRKFCEANGIQGSKQTWKIRKPQGDDEAVAAEVEAKRPKPAPEPVVETEDA